ncbi:MAG: acyl-CoA dehydrogenase family protein [Rhodoferax sp.]
MDFNFSDDQQQLRDAVSRWVDKGYGFERRRTIEKAGGFDRSAWNEIAELGLCGLYVSADDGGLGLGPVEGMLALEALGRGIVLEPLEQSLIAGAVLGAYADAATRAAWLPGVASGEKIITLAYQERGARYRLERCTAQAQAQASGHTVSGLKSLVAVGDQADAYLISAQLDGSLALFLVPRGEGVSTRGYGTQDGSRAAELQFTNAPATLVARDGLAALEYAVDLGLASACARAVGVMDKTVAITAEYLNTRKQFGVAISSFQALRHRMADMKMQLELARSMGYYATLKLGAPAPERRQALSRAKVQLGQSMRFVGQQAVQLHGGIGVTDEYIVSHYFKVLTQLEMAFGDTLHHLGEVSSRMQDTAGVFA